MLNEINALKDLIASVGPDQVLFVVAMAALVLVGYALHVIKAISKSKRGDE